MSEEILERNKRHVIAFHDLMSIQCKPAEAIVQYAGDSYIEHNPHVERRATLDARRRETISLAILPGTCSVDTFARCLP